MQNFSGRHTGKKFEFGQSAKGWKWEICELIQKILCNIDHEFEFHNFILGWAVKA